MIEILFMVIVVIDALLAVVGGEGRKRALGDGFY
jgi:hypothetical protein